MNSKNKIKNLQVGVKTILLNSKGEVLLLKRNKKIYRNLQTIWDIPGGRIDQKKNLSENLKREVFEETGVKKFKVLGVIGVQDIYNKDTHIVRVTYISRVTSDVTREMIRLSKEHTECKWLHVKYIKNLKGIDPHIKDILKDKAKMSFINNVL